MADLQCYTRHNNLPGVINISKVNFPERIIVRVSSSELDILDDIIKSDKPPKDISGAVRYCIKNIGSKKKNSKSAKPEIPKEPDYDTTFKTALSLEKGAV
ncbi:hypothetical protein [Methanolacinia petrolearia]|uniref:hypothetical protein n=1 Tax=Methanolacinia petrolearia TaxID=54120 RepID=UPI001651608C|nr:hypothetical protein [Methanolacinia petrolearia]